MATTFTLTGETVVALTGTISTAFASGADHNHPYTLIWNNGGTDYIIGNFDIESGITNFDLTVTLPAGTYTTGTNASRRYLYC